MKNYFIHLSILFSVLLISCDSEDQLAQTADITPQQNVSRITRTQAIELAINKAYQLYGSSSRGNLRSSRSDLCEAIIDGASSRNGSDTLLHIVNFEDGMGYAVVCATNPENPVLIMVDEGSFERTNLFETPELEMLYEMALDYSAREAANGGGDIYIPPVEPFRKYVIVEDTIGYAIATREQYLKWGQRNPEGWNCRNGLAGCVPLSMAMSMAYLHYPRYMRFSYNNEMEYTELDWDAINGHAESSENPSDNLSCCTERTHDMIARICRQIGHRGNANYGEDHYENGMFVPAATSIGYDGIVPLARTMFSAYDVREYESFNGIKICYALKNNGMVLVTGLEKPYRGNGHAWIADGGRFVHIKVSEYSVPAWFDGPDPSVVVEPSNVVEKYDLYVHFNFGWSGSGNCFVGAEILNELTVTTDTNRYTFDNIKMIRITPKQ